MSVYSVVMTDEFTTLADAFAAAKKAASELSDSIMNISVDTTSMTTTNANAYGAYSGGSPGLGSVTSGGAYNTPSVGNIWPASPNLTQGFDFHVDTCPMGHQANTEDVEYIDGVIISRCVGCNVRMQMNKVPGGVALLRIQHLLGRVMSIDDETRELEGFDLGQILSDFSEIRATLETDEFALRQARKLFDLAAQVLQTKVTSEE